MMNRILRCLATGLLATIPASLLFAAPPKVETLATGLNHPWCVAFLPDGRWLITERAGQLRILDEGGLRPEPVAGVPAVYAASQGGLFDVLPARDFANSGHVYLSFAHGTPDANATRVVRARLVDDRLEEVTPIFTAAPNKDTPVHYGGRMAWLPDGTLLLTLGDGFDYREAAQRLDSHLGTIVRVNADGSIPDDNPFVDQPEALDAIYTYGNRNVQGLVVDEQSGRVYAHEHGPRGGDEINRLQPGGNYGWPVATHGIDYSGAVISPYKQRPGMIDPLVVWTPSIAPSGMALYRGERFADWQGNLLVSTLAERSLRRVELDASGRVVGQHVLMQDRGVRLRDVRVAPDGAVIVLTDAPDGRVLRLTPG
ncbi:PQQ-dependent sugar dehydrogenase [Abyssibacter profundi]|nr:PQQ-dependent sugar dehydrogenase [Abyssibacter profundi]